MKLHSAALTLVFFSFAAAAQADVIYQLDSGSYSTRFNNSATTETEDNWVANSFQVVSGGNHLSSLTFQADTLNNQVIDAAIYEGNSVTDPSGLVLISTTSTTLTASAGWNTIFLDKPVDLATGQIFYAALLLPNVQGGLFPFYEDTGSITPSGRSFFDVGPTVSGTYDLLNTANATVLGGTHPLLGPGEQYAGNLSLRVNASQAAINTDAPEPATLVMLASGLLLAGLISRKKRRPGDV